MLKQQIAFASENKFNFLLLFVLLTFYPSLSLAGNAFQEMDDNINKLGVRIACEQFDFNQKRNGDVHESLSFMHVHQTLRPSERNKCVIDSVHSGKIPATAKVEETKNQHNENPYPSRGPKMSFSFTPAQSFELIEMCKENKFKSNSVCSDAILPNESRIMADLNTTIQ